MKKVFNKYIAVIVVLVMIITIGANSFSYSINTLNNEIDVLDGDEGKANVDPEGEPDDPETPVDPGNPDDSGNPGNPDDSGNPGNTDDTDNPGNTDDTDNPGNPDDTGNPGNTDDTDNPGNTDDTDNPGNTDDTDNPGDPIDPVDPGSPGTEEPAPEFLPYKVVFFVDEKEIEDWSYEGVVPVEEPFVDFIKEPELEELPEGYVLDEDMSTELPFTVTEDNYTIYVYYVMGLLNRVMAAVGGEYKSDSNTIIVPTKLDGQSTNTHTIPLMIWVENSVVHAAVKATHKLDYMQIGTVKHYTKDVHYIDGAKEQTLTIKVNGTEYVAKDGLSGNTKDAHWTVFKFSLNDLFIPEDGKLHFVVIGIGGGHDVDNDFIAEVPKINITGHKVWAGGGNTTPVTLELLRKVTGSTGPGTLVTTGVVNGNENPAWTYTWQDMPQYSPYGQPYTYSIDEESVPIGYEKSINGMTVTNTFLPRGEITIKKIVENYNGDQEFDIFIIGSNGKTYTLTLKNGDSETITGLDYADYEIVEIVPMNFEQVSISKQLITITRDHIEDSATVTNKRTNDGWFYDDDERINNITVGVTTARSIPIEEKRSIELELDAILPREDLADDEFILEEVID